MRYKIPVHIFDKVQNQRSNVTQAAKSFLSLHHKSLFRHCVIFTVSVGGLPNQRQHRPASRAAHQHLDQRPISQFRAVVAALGRLLLGAGGGVGGDAGGRRTTDDGGDELAAAPTHIDIALNHCIARPPPSAGRAEIEWLRGICAAAGRRVEAEGRGGGTVPAEHR